MMIEITGIVLLISGLALVFHRLVMKGHIKYTYPPGPNPTYLVGNLFDVPTDSPWMKYSSWAKQYGDIFHFTMLGQHVVVLNSMEIADDLLEKRSRTYSDRPLIPTTNFFGFSFHLAFMPYGDRWRKHRRIFHQYFRPTASETFRPIQAKKVQDLIFNLLDSPEQFLDHLKTYAAAIVVSSIYGQEIEVKDDPYVKIADQSAELIIESFLPGAALVNMFPILMNLPTWFPGTNIKKLALKCQQLTHVMQEQPFNRVRSDMASGELSPSMISDLLENNDSDGGSKENETVFKAVAATAYSAGAETTSSSLASFVLAMTLHPEAQEKAQSELDLVIGKGRLPLFSDRVSLPYLEAVYRETFRWYPILPLGVPHATSEHDTYKGYDIPKGATVLSNIWAMTHDPSVYPEPDSFKPERFLTADGQLTDDSQILAFGFGRRYMAEASVWIAMASILSMFDIGKVDRDFSEHIEMTSLFTDGLVCHPRPFRCSITPRSEERSRAVRQIQAQAIGAPARQKRL